MEDALMNKKLVNKKYSRAGRWNILCGALFILTLVSYLFLFIITYFADSTIENVGEDLAYYLTTLYPVFLNLALILFSPILMICVGKNMRKGNVEKWTMKFLFGINELMKLASLGTLIVFCALNLVLSAFSNEIGEIVFGVYVICGGILALFILMSGIMDLIAFFSKEK